MSLLRKIRRRHKAFVLKRSAQIHGDGAAAVFPVDDGEDGDEDEDPDFTVNSLPQTDQQNGDISVSTSHGTHQKPFSMEHFCVQTDAAAHMSILIPAESGIEVGHGMQIVGKESRFWFRIAKTAAFLLVTVGGFSVGKLAAVGITLTVALACKLFARDQINSGDSFISADTEQGHRSHETNAEVVRPDSETALESNDPVGMLVSHLVMNANGDRQMTLQAHDEEASEFKASGDTLLTQRRKLKRLNCIKLPPSAPFVEAMEDSPSSSAKASPRTWFRNAGNSSPTGNGSVTSSAEMSKHEKFKSKVLLRHLRRKGEPQSAPSSPLSSSQEGSNNYCVASDGSDTERSTRPMAPGRQRSKFRPASPVKEAPVINASMVLPDQQTLQTLAARKVERTLLAATSIANETMVTGVHTDGIRKDARETSSHIPVGRETFATEVHIPPSQAAEKQSALTPATPTSRDATLKVDIHSPLASTHEPPHQRREDDQSARRSVTLISQEGITAVSTNQDSLPVAVLGGKRRRKQVRVKTPWVAAGLMITLTGLFVGRMMAVTGLVCYWYALSFKTRKASGRKR